MVNTVVVASKDDARALLTRSRRVFSGRDDVVITIAGLTPRDRARWNSQLTFWRNVCGCQPGAVGALASLAYCIREPPLPSSALWMRVAASVGMVLASAVAGKLLALAAARVVLAYHIVRLARSVSLPALER